MTGHEAAIKACSTVNPSQPVSVLNAVDDGTGIGFSLVWLNDKGRQSVDVRRRRRWQRRRAATGDAMIREFEPVGDPLTLKPQVS